MAGKAFGKSRASSSLTVLLSALLLFAASCGSPLDYGSDVPEGMGTFVPLFESIGARAIQPDSLTWDSFDVYDLEFIRDDGLYDTNIYRDNTPGVTFRSAPLEMYAGTYTLVITAYKTGTIAGAPGNLATPLAIFIAEDPVVVVAGETTLVEVVLEAYDPAGDYDPAGNGTFTWTIKKDVTRGTVTGGTMEIIPVLPAGAVQTINVPGGNAEWSGSESLREGYYYVDLTIEVQSEIGGDPREFYSHHILHVYRNLTSELTYTFIYDGEFGFITGKLTLTPWDVEQFKSAPFDLSLEGGGALKQGDMIGLNKTNAEYALIRLDNAKDFDEVIWRFDNDLFANNYKEEYLVYSAASHFRDLPNDRYQLSIIGIKDGVPYYTYVFIMFDGTAPQGARIEIPTFKDESESNPARTSMKLDGAFAGDFLNYAPAGAKLIIEFDTALEERWVSASDPSQGKADIGFIKTWVSPTWNEETTPFYHGDDSEDFVEFDIADLKTLLNVGFIHNLGVVLNYTGSNGFAPNAVKAVWYEEP